MRWKKIGQAEERAVRDFLASRETECASAVARFKELAACGFGAGAPGAAWAGFDEAAGGKRVEPRVRSLVLATKTGLVSVVFDDALAPSNRRALARILPLRRISSIQGIAADVDAAERVMARSFRPFAGGTVVDPVDYDLMSLSGPPKPEALNAGPEGIVVRRAYDSDAELLFPMQAAYELEEVVPAGGSFNAAAARLSFERALREKPILYAVVDGKAVGKAGTNARAYTLDQIGGVYVLPEYRVRGIARRLVAELALLLRAEGRGAVLFVKKRNESARRAYERVGFARGRGYRITYYTEAAR